MKLQHLMSATVLVQAGGLKILMDPWLVDGEYYGSWAHYPRFEWSDGMLDNIDFIYVSHIHPDHLSAATMARLPKSVPVLIHRYESKFLKRVIEAMGFEVRELPHNTPTDLGHRVTINILAADDCNPELCGRFLGCAAMESRFGSTQIDTIAVLQDGWHTLVNTNDCPYPLTRGMLPRIRAEYGRIDFLLVGHSGAGPYPQCFANLSLQETQAGAARKKLQFLEQGAGYIRDLAPRYVMPFAGQYTLAGRLSALDELRGVSEVEEAQAYFAHACRASGASCILLNSGTEFDLSSGKASAEYVPTDLAAKRAYRDHVLAGRRYTFEEDEVPSQDDLELLLQAAFERLTRKRLEVGFSTHTVTYVACGDGYFARIPMNGGELKIQRGGPEDAEPHVTFAVDPRLLARILKGPRFAHWNNAEIGSHIRFDRRPDNFDRALHHCMNFFHA